MFKEILIFMLLYLQFSNGSWNSWGSGAIGKITDTIGIADKDTSCKENATKFIANNYFAAGGTIPITISRICILSNYQREQITEHPAKYIEDKILSSQTSINIEISKFQIKRIKEDSVVMSLDYKVDWVDQRLQVLQFQYFKDVPFSLDETQQKSIWIPHLKMGTEMISLDKIVDYVRAEIRGNFKPNSHIGDVGNGGWLTSGARVEKSISVTTEVACELDFKRFPFDHHVCSIEFEDKRNETVIDDIGLKRHPKMSNKKNNYIIKVIEEYSHRDPARFGINITFERDIEETYGILMNYNLMCAIIVLVSSVNFLVDPKVVPGRAGVLVTLFLVLTNFFCNAQDEAKGFTAVSIYIMVCMTFIALAMMYYGLILFKLRTILKIKDENWASKEHEKIQLSNSVIKFDRFMLIIYVLLFFLFNVYYFLNYLLNHQQ